MLIAAAAKAATESHWWDDWLKFTPGWLAFVWTVGLGARKVFVRQHHLALGPEAEELRTHLRETRALLEEVTSGGVRADWFTHPDRSETARKLRDAAGRRDDAALKLTLNRLADAWDGIFALAPPPRSRVRFVGGDGSPADRNREAAMQDAADLGRVQQMADRAREALLDVQTALDRLNELERKTLGR